MKLTATYVYPVTVTVDVPDDATDEQQRAVLDLSVSQATPDLNNPILHECDGNPNLID